MNTETLEKVDAVSRRVIHATNVPGRDETSRLQNDGAGDIATYVYDWLAKRRDDGCLQQRHVVAVGRQRGAGLGLYRTFLGCGYGAGLCTISLL